LWGGRKIRRIFRVGGPLLQFTQNAIDHHLEILVQLAIPEAEYFISPISKKSIALFIVGLMLDKAVMASIEFYRNFRTVFREIEGVPPKRHLPSKLASQPEVHFAQLIPESSFLLCRILAQTASALETTGN
jgi:hypothetical protein